MKKILVLGATAYQIPLIKLARLMGFFVISSDNFIGNPGHKYSDESIAISTVDTENILHYSKSKGINGIITGGSDSAIPTIGFVCDSLGLPGITFRQGDILSRKDKFRKFQKEQGLKFPEFFILDKLEDFLDIGSKIKGSFILKPTDRSGSIDVEIINFPIKKSDYEKTIEYFNNAMNSSLRHTVILEEFVNGIEYGGDLFVKNKKIISFFLTNKYLLDKKKRVPIGHTIPVKLATNLQDKIKNDLDFVLKTLEINNGPVNFDIMLNNDKEIVILEMSPRFGGNCIPQIINLSTGFNEIKQSINLAMGLPIETPSNFNIIPSGARIIRSSRNGILRQTSSLKTIKNKYKNFLREIVFDYKIGEYVNKFSQGRHRIGHFIVSGNSIEIVGNIIEEIEKDMEIIVE